MLGESPCIPNMLNGSTDIILKTYLIFLLYNKNNEESNNTTYQISTMLFDTLRL